MKLSIVPKQTPHHPVYICTKLKEKYNVLWCNYSGKVGSSQFEYEGKQAMVELTPNKEGTIVQLLWM